MIKVDNIKENKAYYLLLLVAGIIFYVFTQFTVLKHDDLLYGTVIGSDFKPIQSISDFFTSIAALRANENGRTATILSQLFMVMPTKVIFNVCNTLVFMWMLHLIGKLTMHHKHVVITITLFLALLLTRFPSPGDTMLWISGSIGYMWSTTFTLAMGWFIMKQNDPETVVKPCRWCRWIFLFVGGIIAGSMNESVALPLICAYILRTVFIHKSIHKQTYILFISYFIGVLIILTAPSLWLRAGEDGLRAHGTIMNELMGRGMSMGKLCVSYVAPAAAIIAIIYQWVKMGFKDTFRRIDVLIFLFCFAMIFALGDFRKQRLHFFFAVVSFLVAARTFVGFIPAKKWVTVLLAITQIGCLGLSYRAFGQIKRHYDMVKEVYAEIKASGPDCVIESKEWALPASRWVATNYFDSASYGDYVRTYCRIFGKHSLAFVRPEIMKKYHAHNITAGSYPTTYHSDHPDLISGTIRIYNQQDFSTIPINYKNVDTKHLKMKYYLREGNNRLETPEKYHHDPNIKANLNKVTAISYYPLLQDGKCYLVTLVIEPDIEKIEIPVIDNNGKPVTVTLQQ